MSGRRLLIDNDAFILLAGADSLRAAVDVLGFSLDEARRLRTLEFMLRKPSIALRNHPANLLDRALEECAHVRELDDAPLGSLGRPFESIPEVDSGEALLLAVTAAQSFHYLASNDKRAMRAVAQDPRLKSVRDAVSGRVICMEAVLSRLIQVEGPELIAQRFRGARAMDKRIAAFLSPVATGRPQDCLTGVNSFLAGLQKELGEGFLWTPATLTGGIAGG